MDPTDALRLLRELKRYDTRACEEAMKGRKPKPTRLPLTKREEVEWLIDRWRIEDRKRSKGNRTPERRCAQCGQTFRAKPCGFAHARIGRWYPK